MKSNPLLLFVALCLVFVTGVSSQNYRIQNSIGIYGGLTQFNIETDDLMTTADNGWLVGLAATVDLPHRWYNVSYNIQIAENNFGVSGAPSLASQQEVIDYKLFTAQIALIGHLKLIGHNLTIDAGPMLQYNGKLDIEDDNKANYLISGYNTITAEDITDILKFNVNVTTGITLGFDSFKLRGQYIYGFTNILNKLNDQNLSENANFKGNQNMLVVSAMFLF